MNDYFPNKPPRRDLTPEEKTWMARKFCRRARLTDACILLAFLCLLCGRALPGGNLFDIAGLLLALVAVLLSVMTYVRCPCCGRMARRGECFGFFVWRGFECPACGFMPEWSK